MVVVGYTDLFNTAYYSITVGDETHILAETDPKPVSIDGQVYNLEYFKKITDGDAERLAEAYKRFGVEFKPVAG